MLANVPRHPHAIVLDGDTTVPPTNTWFPNLSRWLYWGTVALVEVQTDKAFRVTTIDARGEKTDGRIFNGSAKHGTFAKSELNGVQTQPTKGGFSAPPPTPRAPKWPHILVLVGHEDCEVRVVDTAGNPVPIKLIRRRDRSRESSHPLV